jgi:5-oxoprolinase (ATP-hydrolysing)
LQSRLDRLEADALSHLTCRGFQKEDCSADRYLNLRFKGTDVALMVAAAKIADYRTAFLDMYHQEFGFVLQGRDIVVDDARHAHTASPEVQGQ